MNTDLLVNKYQYISFDVFDTLIKRSIAKPSDLFLLMEKHLAKTRPEIPAGFAQRRLAAEREGIEGSGRHIKISEIYDRLRGEYGEYTNELMDLEIQMELMGCQPNPKYVEWLSRYVSDGRTVVLISDMYLPSEIIAQMLDKCGIRGYKKLYVSCEHDAKKRDGSLFRIVLDDLDIRPEQLVHIGDSKRGDVLAPIKKGIMAVWARNDQKRICRTPKTIAPEEKLAYRTLRACIRNCSQRMSEYEKMGCELFGPQLYGFTEWLIECLKKDGVRDVYFLARDGYMLKRAFDVIGAEGIKIHYLLCSRRAFQLPLLRNSTSLQDTKLLFWHRKRLTLRRFLLQLGLEPEEYKDAACVFALDIDHDYPLEEFVASKEVARFYDSIRDKVVENAKQEYEALMGYLQSLHMPKKAAMVDIGYFGTIQKCLDALIEENSLHITTYGYYFTLSERTQEAYGINALGYHYKSMPSELIFEAQFLKPKGSLKKFEKRSEGDIAPVFEEFEYKDDAKKLIDEIYIIDQYQAGAIEFVGYMKKAFPPNSFSAGYGAAAHDFERLRTRPTLKEAAIWGKFRYINYTTGYLANPRSVFYYIVHPRKFFSDIHACGWRIGFLKRLLKLPLPYEKLYLMLKKILAERAEG